MKRKTIAKKIGLIIGAIIYCISIIMILYLAAEILKGGILDISSLINILVFIGSPLLIGTILITYGIEEVKRRKFVKSVEVIVFIVYLLILIVILFKGIRTIFSSGDIEIAEYFKYNSNLIPFKTIGTYIKYYINDSINTNVIVENLLGNLLMFAPLGFFLPCFSKRFLKQTKFITTIVIILIGVEILQIILYLGTFDIDDIILNFIGTYIMYALVKIKRLNLFLKKKYLLEIEG